MNVNKWIVSLYLHYFGEVNFAINSMMALFCCCIIFSICIWCCYCCCCASRNCSRNRAWRSSSLSLHRTSYVTARSCFAFSRRNSLVSLQYLLDFLGLTSAASSSMFLFEVSPSFPHAFLLTSSPLALSASICFLLTHTASCDSASCRFSQISSIATSNSEY